ncbi:MAG TPA: hypothetical protein VGP72_27070 [Planctomycetota bacterium]|jgi:hypothetical protein
MPKQEILGMGKFTLAALLVAACLPAISTAAQPKPAQKAGDARPSAMAEFRQAYDAARYKQAAEALPKLTGNEKTAAAKQFLEVLPLLQWSNENWDQVLQGIEVCAQWNEVEAMLSHYLGAAAAPEVPRNAQMAALLDRAIKTAKRFSAQKVHHSVARALAWYGDFARAFAVCDKEPPTDDMLDMVFETLADKPEVASNPANIKLAIDHLPKDGPVLKKAIRALAYIDKLDLALQVAAKRATPAERAEGIFIAARYSRYGKHLEAYEKGMLSALAALKGIPDAAEGLILFRDILKDASELPIIPLSDGFWQTAEKTALAFGDSERPAALAELTGAAAWAGRPNADANLKTLAGTPWDATARHRLACGLWWNGKKEKAKTAAKAIADAGWRNLAFGELAYLAAQQGDNASADALRAEIKPVEGQP